MASLLSKLMNVGTRGAMWMLFRKRLPVADYRAGLARLDRPQPLPKGVASEDVQSPVAGRWLRPAAAQATQVLLYLHGGAFSFRLANGHTAMVARLCADAGVAAFMPWYRLSPEDPHPAAPQDCLAAYRGLLATGHRPQDIVVMGDSAGGNLALVLLHLIQRESLPMPAGAITLSPVTDLAQISATWRLNDRSDPMYRVQAAVDPLLWYCPGGDPLDPIISPYYGSFAGFPPMYFVVGSIEALLDDSVAMVRKAVDNGIVSQVHIWGGMPHVFMLQEHLPETPLARQRVVAWLHGLREPRPAPPAGPGQSLHRACVQVFDLDPLTRALRTRSNTDSNPDSAASKG